MACLVWHFDAAKNTLKMFPCDKHKKKDSKQHKINGGFKDYSRGGGWATWRVRGDRSVKGGLGVEERREAMSSSFLDPLKNQAPVF